MVERWAPISAPTRDYLHDLLAFFSSVASDYDLPVEDQDYWQALAEAPDQLLQRQDACYRELFVTVTAVASAR